MEAMLRNPEMMRMAQEHARNMTPEQIRKMQAQMARMDPAALAKMGLTPEMARQAGQMSPEDVAAQQRQMANLSPEELQRQMAAQMGAGGVAPQSSANQEYMYKASEMLKKAGNNLVGEGEFTAAMEKYRRAKSNLALDSTSKGKELRKSCMLNLSLCLLKTGDCEGAAAEASEVVALDNRSLKGYYRRGLARKEAGRLREAVEDMARALSLAPDDATVAKELQEARAAAATAGVSLDDLSTELDAPAQPPPPPPPGLGGMSPEQLRAAQEAMRQDPEMLKNMGSMMENMSEEQLAQMNAQMPGGMKLTPEMAKMASAMMKDMPAEALSKMMEMTSALGAGGGAGPTQFTPEMMEKVSETLQSDPEMMKSMADMMANISPEKLEQMTGMKVSPEQLQQVSGMMKDMKPEHMQMMMKAAAAIQTWAARAKAARAWVSRNSTLVSAIAVVGAGMLVRRWLARRFAAPPPVLPPPLQPQFGGFEEWSADAE